MNAASDSGDRERSLAFFGAASAGLSHEINNVLAIINELSGLIGDVVAAADRAAVPPDAARLRAVLGRISAQIDRGKEQVRLLNRLAHSVDGPDGDLDAGEVVALAVALGRRSARLRKVTLDDPAADGPLALHGRAFDLLHVLLRCLGLALAQAKAGSRVAVRVGREEGGVRVRLELGECVGAGEEASTAAAVEASEAVRSLGGRLDTPADPGQPGCVSLWLPGAPGAGRA